MSVVNHLILHGYQLRIADTIEILSRSYNVSMFAYRSANQSDNKDVVTLVHSLVLADLEKWLWASHNQYAPGVDHSAEIKEMVSRFPDGLLLWQEEFLTIYTFDPSSGLAKWIGAGVAKYAVDIGSYIDERFEDSKGHTGVTKKQLERNEFLQRLAQHQIGQLTGFTIPYEIGIPL